MIPRMKVMSKVSLSIGILAVLAAAAIMGWGSLDIWGNMQPKNSINPINPFPSLWIGFAAGVLGGFFTGLGLVSSRKAKQVPQPVDPQG
jgi:TRAP-type C4-dicarboxylate transport system permease small subunit